MQKQLKVVGKGKVNIVPDQTIIELTITKKENTYEKAIETSSVQSEMVKKVLVKLGINKESIKTKRFEINPVYKYKTIDGYSKSYIDGFEFNNKLSFIFGIDNKLLGKILYQISKLDIESKINITYSYSKQEEAKEQLLICSVKDAFFKAKVLAEASAVELIDIIDISHSYGDEDMFISPFRDDVLRDCCCNKSAIEDESYDIDINPDDIVLNDVVTIIWEIK